MLLIFFYHEQGLTSSWRIIYILNIYIFLNYWWTSNVLNIAMYSGTSIIFSPEADMICKCSNFGGRWLCSVRVISLLFFFSRSCDLAWELSSVPVTSSVTAAAFSSLIMPLAFMRCSRLSVAHPVFLQTEQTHLLCQTMAHAFSFLFL